MRYIIKFLSVILLLGIFSGVYFWPDIRSFFLDDQGLVETAKRKFHNFYDIPLPGTPELDKLNERLARKKVKLGDPIFMRIFKKESELELWVKKGNQFIHFETYPICRWSGRLGPKLQQGDRQAPEGFYTVSRGQLNPNSRFYRSFNLGYPNKYDLAHKRTGDFLMVHGNCVSIGCYAMTDPVMGELWTFVTKALIKGQKRFHVHAFPFRMTELNMALHYDDFWYPFWADLKKGYDLFEQTRIPPRVNVCDRRYVAHPDNKSSIGNTLLTKNCKIPRNYKL